MESPVPNLRLDSIPLLDDPAPTTTTGTPITSSASSPERETSVALEVSAGSWSCVPQHASVDGLAASSSSSTTATTPTIQSTQSMIVKRPRGRPRGSKKEKPPPIPKIKAPKSAAVAKLSKRSKAAAAKAKLSTCLMQRIFETCPLSFLYKARLISRQFKHLIDDYPSIWVNCRKYNFGSDMPPPPQDMTERQYCNLLDGKGCVEPGCTDTKAEKTYWTWYKRWCTKCWLKSIVREDRVIKEWRELYSPIVTTKLLQCVPYSMQDSWGKPHDIDLSVRSAGEYKLNKVYRLTDLRKIRERYKSLDPGFFSPNRTLPQEEQDAQLAEHRRLVETLEQRREAFFEQEQAAVQEHMDRVMKIEACVRTYRKTDPVTERNKEARKSFFQKRASEDIAHIPIDFVTSTKCYKEACRISRNGGTERSWQILKVKIVSDWETHRENEAEERKKAALSAAQVDAAGQTGRDSQISSLPGIRDLDRPNADGSMSQHLPTMPCMLPDRHPAYASVPMSLRDFRLREISRSLQSTMAFSSDPGLGHLQQPRVTVASMLEEAPQHGQTNAFGVPINGPMIQSRLGMPPFSSTMHPLPLGGSSSWPAQGHAAPSRPPDVFGTLSQGTLATHTGFQPPPEVCEDIRRRGYFHVTEDYQALQDPNMIEWLVLNRYPWRIAGTTVDIFAGAVPR